MDNFKILFVDDDRDILNLVENYLSRYKYDIQVVDSAKEALALVKAGKYDVVFTDYKMPEFDGLELLSAIKAYKPETVVVIVTGHGTMDSAIDAMRFGSYDYIQKPFKLEVLKLLIDKVCEEQKLKKEAVFLRHLVKPRHRYDALVGMNLKMQEIYETIDRIKGDSAHVLIYGEAGTGKELAARVIHNISDRGGQPFISAKCVGFAGNRSGTENLDKLARLFESAHGGTIFFDDIGQMPIDLQQIVYNALQTGKLSRGGGRNTQTDAMVIASSSTDLHPAAEQWTVDTGLFEQLSTVFIKMPPLRERKEDICPLIICLLDRLNEGREKKIGGISARVMDVLLTYNWPGNIIELENVIERAAAVGVETTICFDDLPPDIKTFGKISGSS